MIHRLVAPMLMLAAITHALAQDATGWRPVPGRLMTRWADGVSPEKAWPEYPRPQMVRERWMNLNGLWSYAITPAAATEPGPSQGQILVPFPIESALSGVAKPLEPSEKLWYRRTFRVPPEWTGGRVLLHFGAVDWRTEVRINGAAFDPHEGGYDPFEFDITGALRSNADNELIVAVTDPTDEGGQPRGKQCLNPESIWYTRTSGIWQTVWLEPVPQDVYIRSLRITPDLPHSSVTVSAEGAWPTGGPPDLRIDVMADGQVVATGRSDHGAPATAVIPSPRLWSPADPYLYELRVRLTERGQTDEVRAYFGMRDIKVGADGRGIARLMLNGKPLFQFGPLDQGFWPDGFYTPPTDEAMKSDIEAVKRMGGNMLRKHVKVEPDRFYTWCDRLGVLVWQDMPSPFTPEHAGGVDWKADYLRELRAMIDTHRNHPSIVMWVPFNESWGQHDTEAVVASIHEWDPTRLVDNASGWTDAKIGDVADVHAYPGPGMPASSAPRAAVLGEFGGLGLPVEGHTWTDRNNWGYVSFKGPPELTDAYVGLIARLRPLIAQGLCAAVYTQTTDVEVECNGWLTYDRAVWKIDPQRAAPPTLKLYGPPPELRVLMPAAFQKREPWRYTTDPPAEGWQKPGFDDSAWRSGAPGFGTEGTPGAVIGTEWNTADIWIRRTFDLPDAPIHEPYLILHHDEDAEVFVNGAQAVTAKGFVTSYGYEPLNETGSAFRVGANTVAVHCHQTRGGQFIDAGLVDLVPANSVSTPQLRDGK